jgi:cytochrome c-type biogenesis protein CcmE
MTPQRRKRLYLVLGIVVGVGAAAALALSAFRQSVTFYFIPTEVAQGAARADQSFRLGGMVKSGSVRRVPGSLEVSFVLTDFKHDVPVTYDKVLPELFREGQGVIAHGRLDDKGVLVADEVLAKHDENYMPPKIPGTAPSARGGS